MLDRGGRESARLISAYRTLTLDFYLSAAMGYRLQNNTRHDIFLGASFDEGEGEAGDAPERLHLGPKDPAIPEEEATPVKIISDDYFEALVEDAGKQLERFTRGDVVHGEEPDLRIADGVSDPEEGYFRVPDAEKFEKFRDGGESSIQDADDQDVESAIMDRIE